MQYKNISWDENDLISSKQAVTILLREDEIEALNELDEQGCFGNLDVDAVIDEWFFGE